MKFFKYTVLLSIFITSIVNADYIRSIRMGSFPSQADAQSSLQIINAFVVEHENLQELLQERDFIFKVRSSGKYYVTVVEPFTNRKVLQEVLDTLRLEFKDIYVTKLKSLPYQAPHENKTLDVSTIIEKELPKVIQEDALKVEVTPKSKESLQKVSISLTDVVTEEKEQTPQLQDATINNYHLIITLLALVIAILVRYIVVYKRENESYVNKEMISTEQLEQTQMDNTIKDKLLSHVSHELRTPMTAIMGLTHLVLESDLTKIQKDYIQKIENSSQHLLNLINDILDVSKIKAGELTIEKVEFNINDILEYVLSVNATNAKRSGIALNMDVAQDVPSRIIGDSLRLGQVLINLIGNAIKFTEDGEVTLVVKNVSDFGDELKLEFSVSDTGIGMTQEQVGHIFSSYYQATDSTSRKFGGTGLGLSISKELVEMMGGEIKVHSQKDVGTTFTFTVNLQLKDAQNKRQYRLPSSSMLHKKILIVDASNKNVIPLIKALGYFNYVTNTLESFESIILEDVMKFDILIINQYNLTKVAKENIQRIQKISSIKIVVLSELYSNMDMKLVAGCKIDSYIQVPCTQQNVLNMIIELYVAKNLDSRSRKITLKDKLKTMANKKILVAEDNDVNQKVILGLLSQTGIELTFVDDGQEALDLIRKDIHFDLVLMDINMPNMNGYEASREIRKSKKYNSLPILALTGDVMDDAISKALNSGMQGHIAKPIIVDIFYKKIFDTLSSHEVNFSKVMLEIPKKLESEDGFSELSIAVGLGRCHGDKEFYKSLLTDFKNMYMNSSKRFMELCENNKFKEARRISMDIKDVALNIGAYNLCESAATMEYEFEKGSRSNWREFVKFYDATLEKLFNEINRYLIEK